MKRLSNNLLGVLAAGIAGTLCAGSASAQTPQFIQVSPLYFTMPVGSNPLAQTVTMVSTGTAFSFNAPTAQTAGGGDWLKVTGTSCINSSSYYNNTPAACTISVSAATLPAGIYIGQVTFNNGSTAMTVPVTLTVGNPGSGGNKPVIRAANGVVNGASFLAGIVPGSFATIFGTHCCPAKIFRKLITTGESVR